MTLQDVCELIVDCPHSTANDDGNGYPLIRTPNIGKGRLLLDGVHRVSKDVYNKRNQRAVPQDDDLILAREAPAGNVAIIKNGEKVCLGQRTVLLRPDKAKVFPDYLVYYLLAPQQQYHMLGTANGATVAHVNIPTIRKLPVDLPPMNVQTKIGGFLSSIDSLIENHRRQIALLEEAAQRIYKEWFDHRSHDDWQSLTVNDIAEEIKNSVKPDEINADTPYIGLEHIPRRDICLSTWSNSSDVQSNKYRYQKNDIIFGKIRPYFHKVGFAINDGVVSTDSFVMRPKGPCWGFLLMTVSSDAFVDFASVNCKEGSKMPRADWQRMTQFKIMLPPHDILQRFERIIKQITSEIRNLALQIHLLQEARDRLLPKLLSGEIEV